VAQTRDRKWYTNLSNEIYWISGLIFRCAGATNEIFRFRAFGKLLLSSHYAAAKPDLSV
jgi:hypothetical protein